MDNHDEMVAAIADWNAKQNADWRAAGELLIANGHWLRDDTFVTACVSRFARETFIEWEVVEQLLERRHLTGTTAELAVLRIAVMIVMDAFDASSVDVDNSRLVVNALAAAFDVDYSGGA